MVRPTNNIPGYPATTVVRPTRAINLTSKHHTTTLQTV